MIRLHVLGALRLELDGATPRRSILAQPRRTALLAYLALRARRGPERRDTLLGMFWPTSDTGHARGALRNALHFLRGSLGGDVITTRRGGDVELDPTLFWCDAAEFERLCDTGEHAAALRLYAGDLLDGFFISEASEFEEWLAAERDRLRQRAVQAARSHASDMDVPAGPEEPIARLRRLLELAPTDETAARRLMAGLAAAGDRGEALRVFGSLSTRLAQDYGIEPSRETQLLARAIRE